MSPDFLEALVALREEVAHAHGRRLVLSFVIDCHLTGCCLQHTRRLAAIEGQYYGGSAADGNDGAASAADEESQSLSLPLRAHGGGSSAAPEANDAGDRRSGGRPVSTSAAGRKADGLVRIAFNTHPFLIHVTMLLSVPYLC